MATVQIFTYWLVVYTSLVLFGTDKCQAIGGSLNHYKWRRSTTSDNYISDHSYRSSLYVRDAYSCGLSCHTDSHCYSFFYVDDSKLCRMEGTIQLSTAGLSYRFGARYYAVTDGRLSETLCPPDDEDFHVTKLTDNSYIRYRIIKSWVDVNSAIKTCTDNGARVFQPIGVSRNEFLRSLHACPGYALNYWLDGKKDHQFDSWTTWDNSITYTYTYWEPPNPDFSWYEFCLQTKPSGLWNDIACDDSSYVICEKRL